MFEYQALFEPAEGGGFVITFPDFKWGVTQAETEEEGIEMAADIVEIYLGEQIKHGLPLPASKRRTGKGYRTLRLPLLTAVKVELYSAFQKSGITKAELARALKIPRTNVDRLFDIHHKSRLDQMEAAFSALGSRVEIGVKPTAPKRSVLTQRQPAVKRVGAPRRQPA